MKKLFLALSLLAAMGYAHARFNLIAEAAMGDTAQEALQLASQQALASCQAMGYTTGYANIDVMSYDAELGVWHVGLSGYCE